MTSSVCNDNNNMDNDIDTTISYENHSIIETPSSSIGDAVDDVTDNDPTDTTSTTTGRLLRKRKRSSSCVKLPHRISCLFHNALGPPTIVNKKMSVIHTDPNIYIIKNFLNPADIKHLDTIITSQIKEFKSSYTQSSDKIEVFSDERTSTFIFLGKGQDATIRSIEMRAADLVSLSSAYVEPLQIISYTDGQEFQVHHDGGTLLEDGSVEAVYPKRLITIFVYLNTLPVGQGHTHFPELDLSIKPERGSAVMFCNVAPDGLPDPKLVHRACPIVGDLRKIGMNIWIGEDNMQILSQETCKIKPKTYRNLSIANTALTDADTKTKIYMDKLLSRELVHWSYEHHDEQVNTFSIADSNGCYVASTSGPNVNVCESNADTNDCKITIANDLVDSFDTYYHR